MDQCEQNIAMSGRNQRFRAGLSLFSFALLGALLLFRADAHPAWRALLFLPFAMSGVLIFQAMYKTCIVRAMRGERETEQGVEAVASPSQQRLDKLRARLVFKSAGLSALVATAIIVLL